MEDVEKTAVGISNIHIAVSVFTTENLIFMQINSGVASKSFRSDTMMAACAKALITWMASLFSSRFRRE